MRLQYAVFGILGLLLAAAARPVAAQQPISCSSDDGKRHYCSADTRGGVQMVKQRSDARCDQGYSWGYDRRGVWVDHGCRADFLVQDRGQNNGGYGGQGWNNNGGGQDLTCSSDDGKRHYCSADTRGGVQMVNQRSDARCQQGYSWGYDQRGVWVDHGCRADFRANTGGWNNNGGQGWNNGGNQQNQNLTCNSDDGNRHYCSANTNGGVQMVNQRSDARCQQGYSWGYDQRGVWVDHGCRADFAVNAGGWNNNNGGYGGQGWNNNNGGGQSITCSSDDGKRHYCSANTRGGVQMVKQRSDARCDQGSGWGYDQRGIWVDHGCRADFLVR